MQPRIGAPDRVVLLLSVVPYLMEHGETPLAELAEVFGVSPRLMRQLIEFLGTAGVPGETSTYQHEDLFDIDWAALEEEQLVRLTRAVAVDDAPRFSASEQAALIVGLEALAPLLPAEERDHARSAAQKLGSTGSAALSAVPEGEDPAISTVAEAIDAGRRLGFTYRDLRGVDSVRTVEPIALTQSTGGWYLRAHCLDRGAERTFIVHGMRDLRVLDAVADRRADPRPGPSLIGPSEHGLVATVRVRERALGRIADFQPRVIGAAETGWLFAEVDLAYPGAACRLVQAAPGDLIVDAPEPARAAVREWAERTLAGYRV